MKSNTESLDKTCNEAVFCTQKLKSQIVEQISFEFSTPLTSIIGFAEILRDEVQIDEHRRMEYASYIQSEGWRLTELIDDLIDYDSLEQGHVDRQVINSEIR